MIAIANSQPTHTPIPIRVHAQAHSCIALPETGFTYPPSFQKFIFSRGFRSGPVFVRCRRSLSQRAVMAEQPHSASTHSSAQLILHCPLVLFECLQSRLAHGRTVAWPCRVENRNDHINSRNSPGSRQSIPCSAASVNGSYTTAAVAAASI